MRALTYEVTGREPEAVAGLDVVQSALDAAENPPYPRATIRDTLGPLIRVEGRSGQLFVETRRVETSGVHWGLWGVQPAGAGTLTPFWVVGGVRKLRPSEILGRAEAGFLLEAFVAGQPFPGGFELRPSPDEHGNMVILASADRDPRPVGSWMDVERLLRALPAEGPAALALSQPDRTLVGVLGDGHRFAVRFRQSRADRVDEHPVGRTERNAERVTLALDSRPSFRKDQVFERDELVMVLESLYRHEEPPPGYQTMFGEG